MKQIKKVEFVCSNCGSNKLGYKKYVKCITPVSLQENGQFEYSQSNIDEDDYIWADNGFICLDCESFVEHCGCRFETEKEFCDYLTMDPELREKQQNDYDEQLNAQAEAFENEQICFDEEIRAEIRKTA